MYACVCVMLLTCAEYTVKCVCGFSYASMIADRVRHTYTTKHHAWAYALMYYTTYISLNLLERRSGLVLVFLVVLVRRSTPLTCMLFCLDDYTLCGATCSLCLRCGD